MKERLLDLLACPGCKDELSLRADRHHAGEVLEGLLTCRGCGATFPVRGSVPRFVASGEYAASFGFEWSRFRTVQVDAITGGSESAHDLMAKTGLTAEDVNGQLILDAGVGAGRYADVVSRWGGEVIGIDVTEAVDAAFLNIGSRRRVHLLQADIFSLPFRDGLFDIAYSIGVLHHTPDPGRAFRCVSTVVRKGGTVAIYVYPALGIARHFSDVIRTVTTRLPTRLLFGLAWAAVPLYYVYRVPGLGKLCQTLLPISLHPRARWRWLDTFDWYSPTFQFKSTYFAVYEWFRSSGVSAVQIFREPICMRGVKDGDSD